MKLPNMRYADGIVKGKQIRFGGLCRAVGAGDGELRDMRNLTSDHYPVLATRAPRMLYRKLGVPGGLFSWDKLCWVDGKDFYFDGELKGTVTEGQKSFASLGAYVVLLPDKCYYNVDTDTFGSMDAKWSGGYLSFQDGLLYGESAEANAIRCPNVNWSAYFHAGDAVTISGCATYQENNKSAVIREIDGDTMYFYEYSFTVGTESGITMTIARTMPDLKYICEHENRLWGCSENTIYASKLGDIFNWNVYDGLDTDSWAVDTGSAGEFTGCISFRGYPVFFKENHIYKVYGSVASNFEVLGSASLGLADGSAGSLAVAGETLFYLSRSGIMAYTGGIPQPIGAAFGVERFKNAVAGSDGLKYYVSMQGEDDIWGLYVYDTQLGLWHLEDESHVMSFANWNGNLYFMNELGEIWITGNIQDPPEIATEEKDIPWSAEFADFTEEFPNKKGVSKIQIRLELDESATVSVWLQFDSDGQWRQVDDTLGAGAKRSYYLPIIPRRGDHYRLKLTGTGGCRIYSLVREYYTGSELKSKAGRN